MSSLPSCDGCTAKGGRSVQRMGHQYADCNGWVPLCQVLRESGTCQLEIAKSAIELRVLELKLAERQRQNAVSQVCRSELC